MPSPLIAAGANRATPSGSLLPTIIHQFDRIIDHQTAVPARDKGALNPMIDRRGIPGLRRHFDFLGWIVGVARRIRGFDDEGFESTALYGHGFLSGNLRFTRSSPAAAGIDLVGLKTPRL